MNTASVMPSLFGSDAGVESPIKVEGSDYEVVSVGADAYIRVLIDFGTNGILSTYRDMPYTQSYTFVDGRNPAPSSIMRALDRIVWMVQQVAGLAVNALKAPFTETSDMTIPNAVTRAGQFAGYGPLPDAAPIVMAGVVGVPVSSFMETPPLSSDGAEFLGYVGGASDTDVTELEAFRATSEELQKRTLLTNISHQLYLNLVIEAGGDACLVKTTGLTKVASVSGSAANIYTSIYGNPVDTDTNLMENLDTIATGTTQCDSISASDDGSIIVAIDLGNNACYVSTDYGATFVAGTVPSVTSIYSIEFYDGYIYAGSNGDVMKTLDGNTWVDIGNTVTAYADSTATVSLIGDGKMVYSEPGVAGNSYTPYIQVFDGTSWVTPTISGFTGSSYAFIVAVFIGNTVTAYADSTATVSLMGS